MAYLLLVRHGKSEWNKLGLWTGHTDVELTDEGFEEARMAGEAMGDIDIHKAHVSALKRAQQTLEKIKESLGKRQEIETHIHPALNERHYGVHTGKNKWEVRDALGEEAFQNLRRGWNVPIEGGETLKDVHDRVVPYFTQHIHDDLKEGKNVLVVAHGNTLRALIKHLEDLGEDEIGEREVGTGEVHVYDIDSAGNITEKKILSTDQ